MLGFQGPLNSGHHLSPEEPPAERGAQAGIEAAAAAALPSAGLPPLSGTSPIRILFTDASNFPLSPLVALLVAAKMSPVQQQDPIVFDMKEQDSYMLY